MRLRDFGCSGKFPSLLERRTFGWDLPEEQFLQCAGRSRYTILLLNGIDRDFSAVAKMTGYQGQRPGNQPVNQFPERDILPKPMLPESIQARHQVDGADAGSNTMEPKPRLGHDPRETALVEMIKMPRGVQRKPPAAEQLEF